MLQTLCDNSFCHLNVTWHLSAVRGGTFLENSMQLSGPQEQHPIQHFLFPLQSCSGAQQLSGNLPLSNVKSCKRMFLP